MAPKWDVLVYNESTKLGRLFPPSYWLNKLGGKEPMTVKSKTAISTSYKGKPAKAIYLEIEPMDSIKSKGEFFYQSSDKKVSEYTRMEVLELQDKSISPMVLQFIRWRCSMPFLNGPMLKATNIYPDGRRETTINVVSLTPATVPLSEWLPPKKYKAVKSSSLITNDATKIKKAAEMFDTLMP